MLTDKEAVRKNYYEKLEQYHISGIKGLQELSPKKLIKLQGMQADIMDGDFFFQDAKAAIENGNFPNMPLMIGSNADEFSMIEIPMYYKLMGIATKEKELDRALYKKYNSYAEVLKSSFAPLSKDIIDLQMQIMELLVFHSSVLILLEEIGKKAPVYCYRMNYAPYLFKGLRGAYHGAELAFFFDNMHCLNIPKTKENEAAVRIMQSDLTEFVKSGKLKNRPNFRTTHRITEYDDNAVQEIAFPHEDLLLSLRKSGLDDAARASYIQNRR